MLYNDGGRRERMMDFPTILSIILGILAIILGILAIILAVYSIRESKKSEQRAEEAYNQAQKVFGDIKTIWKYVQDREVFLFYEKIKKSRYIECM